MKNISKKLIKALPRNVKRNLMLGLVWELREQIGKNFFVSTEGYVKSGALAGLRLLGPSKWSGFQDLTPKLLGTYEQHLLAELRPLGKNKSWEHFICVGAADGYWALGLKKAGWANSVTAFEVDPESRAQLIKSSQVNKISVAVNSEFDSLSLETVEGAKEDSTLILVDIEGGEYELDWKSMLTGSKAKFIVELHSNNQEVNSRLFRNFQPTHDLRVLKRDQYSVKELGEEGTGFDREYEMLISVSEGRLRGQEWLIATPKNILL